MASLVINGRFIELSGDGMAEGTTTGTWERDPRVPTCFGSFGYLTTQGDVLSAEELEIATSVLQSMFVNDSDPDEAR